MTPNSHQHFAAEENRRIRLPPLRSSAGGGSIADIGPEAYIAGPFSPTHDRRREVMVARVNAELANAEFHHLPPFGHPQQQHPQRRQAPADEDFFIGGDVVVQPKRRRLEFDYDDRQQQQPPPAAGERGVLPMSAQWTPRDVSPTRSSTHTSFFGAIPTDDRSASSAMYQPPAHQQHQLRKSLGQQPFSSNSSRTSTPGSLTAVPMNKQQQMTASTDRSGSRNMAPSEDYDPRMVRQQHQQYIDDYDLRRNQFQADAAEENDLSRRTAPYQQQQELVERKKLNEQQQREEIVLHHPPSAKTAATATTEQPFPQTVSELLAAIDKINNPGNSVTILLNTVLVLHLHYT